MNGQVGLAHRMRGIRQPGEAQQLVVPEDPLYVCEKRAADKVQELDILGVAEQLLEFVEPTDSFSPLTLQSVEQIVVR